MLGARTDGPRIEGVKMGVNYGGNKVRFLAPVRSGKRVRSHVKLLELEEKRPGQWQQTNEVTIEIEGEEKPALIAERSEEHTSELQSLMRISYAVFCLKKKKKKNQHAQITTNKHVSI